MKFGTQIENTFGNNFGYRDIADLSCGGVAYITQWSHQHFKQDVFFLGGEGRKIFITS